MDQLPQQQQQQPQQPQYPQHPEKLRKSASSPPSSSSSSGSEGEDSRGGEGERSQGSIQRQIKKELASMRSSLTNLQRNLLTALNTLNNIELIMAEEESSGGTKRSRHSPPTVQLPQQPYHGHHRFPASPQFPSLSEVSTSPSFLATSTTRTTISAPTTPTYTPTSSPPSPGGTHLPTLKRSFRDLFTAPTELPPPSSLYPGTFHAGATATTTPGTTTPTTDFSGEGRKRRRTTTPAMPLQRGGSRSVIDLTLLGLLPELVLRILAYLDPGSLCQVSLTCTYLKSLADSQPWQALFDQKLGLSWLVLRSVRGHAAGLSWKGHVVEARKVSRKWELGGTQTTLTGHKKAIKNLQFRRNQLLTCDETVIKEWDLDTLKLKESFANSDQKCLTFRFDDEKLMVSTVDTVRVYEQHTKKLLFDLKDIFSPIISLRFDHERIWTGAWNGSITLWSARDGKKMMEMSGHNNPIYCMDVQEDLIVTGSSDKWLKVWSSSSGSCLHTLRGHTKTVQSVQFEGHLVVSSSKDASIRLWDIRSPSPLIGTLTGHTADVTCVRFDATKIVSGSADQNIKVWDMRTHKWMYNLVGHSAGVTCLEFTNAMIVSAAEDAEVKVWRFDL